MAGVTGPAGPVVVAGGQGLVGAPGTGLAPAEAIHVGPRRAFLRGGASPRAKGRGTYIFKQQNSHC